MASDPYSMYIGSRESGGDYGARSKTSSAGGKYQFLDSVWLEAVIKARPDLQGLSKRDLLKLKTDTSDEGRAIQEQTKDYYLNSVVVPSIVRQGIEPTEGNVYLAWFAGPTGAKKVLEASPDTPISRILSEGALAANSKVKLGDKPFSEFTQSDLVAWAGGGGSPQVSPLEEPQEEQTADVLEETVPATMARSAPDRSGRDILNLARYYEGMNQRQAAPLLGIPNLMAARQQQEPSQNGIASLFPYS